MDHRESKGLPEKHILLLHWLYSKASDCVENSKLWKILKEMGIPDHPVCLLRNLYAGQEAKVRIGMEQQTGYKSGKEYIKAVYCHSAYLTYMQITVQSWRVITRTDAEAKAPILWPPDVRNRLIGKDPGGERLKAGGEGDDRGWDGWMALLTWWTWV